MTIEATPTRRATVAWVVYDLANTIFALGVVGLYFPEWLTTSGLADSSLAVTAAAAGFVVIFAAPWVGAVTDVRGGRVRILTISTLVAVATTSFLTRGPDVVTFVVLGLALVSVNIGSVVYDALLPFVSTRQNRGRVSGNGVGVGYVGSFIGVGIGILSLEILDLGYASTFTMLAAGFLLFALPAFRYIQEPRPAAVDRPAPALTSVVGDLARSWRRAAQWPDVIRFLIGRFLYTDAINTLIGGFLTIYAIQEIGLDPSGSRTLLALAIAFAIAGGLGGGRAVERFGSKRVLRWALAGWIAAILAGVAAAVTGVVALAWSIGAVGGTALGATWASDRVTMLEVSPPQHLGEFYGLYATVGRFATILGPLVWALIVDVLGLGRSAAMLVLAASILAGWFMIGRVRI
ncbi:MAG: MFS transporter [Acidimicrobiia bacterium]|nr:MFS transporter [Acidimicrobiia bacterium]